MRKFILLIVKCLKIQHGTGVLHFSQIFLNNYVTMPKSHRFGEILPILSIPTNGIDEECLVNYDRQ